jgi:hypothetical protein
MSRSSALDDPGYCPFLVPVMADRLWMCPIGVYCRRPGRPARIPAVSTVACCCTAEYGRCESYLAASVDRLPNARRFKVPGC